MIKNNILSIIGMSLILGIQSSPSYAAAGYIVKNATVKSVANTFSSGDNFILTATGGTGTCLDQNITFKLDSVFSETIHVRGYSTALTAFVSGSKVNIWSSDGTCTGAYHIQVFK